MLADLLKRGWQTYGAGRVLARNLSVDPATISRDIRSLRKWREYIIGTPNESERVARIFGGGERANREKFADLVLRRLVEARIHPKGGFSFCIDYRDGAGPWMTIARR